MRTHRFFGGLLYIYIIYIYRYIMIYIYTYLYIYICLWVCSMYASVRINFTGLLDTCSFKFRIDMSLFIQIGSSLVYFSFSLYIDGFVYQVGTLCVWCHMNMPEYHGAIHSGPPTTYSTYHTSKTFKLHITFVYFTIL